MSGLTYKLVRVFSFLSLLVLATTVQLNAQEKPKLADCQNTVVQDSSRRLFDDRSSFMLDVDGDGKPDTITPRTYAVKANRNVSGKTKTKASDIHWVTFDLKTHKGRVIKSFFKYNYGTDEADYWVYAFVPCSTNQDGRTALLFYSGDDTSQETVILLNRGSLFKVHSRQVRGLDGVVAQPSASGQPQTRSLAGAKPSANIAEPGFYIQIGRCHGCPSSDWQRRVTGVMKANSIPAFIGDPEFDMKTYRIQFLRKIPRPKHWLNGVWIGPYMSAASAQQAIPNMLAMLRRFIKNPDAEQVEEIDGMTFEYEGFLISVDEVGARRDR
ncbi:MAG: hypothetical protein ND895_22865 [Pyrinomonadaceae bacterium]|nr:hypothetical protein [Pyrinomonadaceae bacterium]